MINVEVNVAPYSAWFSRVLDFTSFLCSDDAIPEPACYRSDTKGAWVIFVLGAFLAGTSATLALWCLLKGMSLLVNKARRPSYYPQEREKRELLRRERRRVKHHCTSNPAPTAEELLTQWDKIRHSPREMLVFGSMLCDLDAYVDNSLVRNDIGKIIGRQPGVRGWLAGNCPVLYMKYKTIMRYKQMAVKFRQATGLEEPEPVANILPPVADAAEHGGEISENTVRNDSDAGTRGREITVRNGINDEEKENEITERKIISEEKKCFENTGRNAEMDKEKGGVDAENAAGNFREGGERGPELKGVRELKLASARRFAGEILAECGMTKCGLEANLARRVDVPKMKKDRVRLVSIRYAKNQSL